MKTAVAYITDNLICPVQGVEGKEAQKESISRFANENGYEIVAWFEDELCTENVLERPGVLEMLDRKNDASTVLVDKVWSLSRDWSKLSRLYAEMDRRGLKLEAATTQWDGVSQMTRRHFDKELSVPPVMKRIHAAKKAGETAAARKPEDFKGKTAHHYEVI